MKGKMWFSLLSLLVLTAMHAQAQKPPETESEFDEGYQRRIRMEYIDGVYIPRDLSDALVQLNQLVDRDARASFKSAPEEVAVRKLHFSLGRWIILNWGFYEGSRLSHSLKGMGIYHPDYMARFIIRSFHRSLNGQPIDVKGQLEAIAAQQEQDRQKRIQQGTVLYQETRKVKKDTVER
ncbi:MAG: hypothetical protein H6573_28805 [Lewinellaceae bacterium]|nr:hypothetical protein [Phaeodactylibacter sp.]MCB0613709.1 hypothetical protein [Phaeodactylibacter sp.]MCB9351466.1 hypothetical protein [Lewinellaceae bacterium]